VQEYFELAGSDDPGRAIRRSWDVDAFLDIAFGAEYAALPRSDRRRIEKQLVDVLVATIEDPDVRAEQAGASLTAMERADGPDRDVFVRARFVERSGEVNDWLELRMRPLGNRYRIVDMIEDGFRGSDAMRIGRRESGLSIEEFLESIGP
jgi:hypothetical protein